MNPVRGIVRIAIISVCAVGCDDDPVVDALGADSIPILTYLCDTNQFIEWADSLYTQGKSPQSPLSHFYLIKAEMHDCQRLAEGNTFGTLAALLLIGENAESENFVNGQIMAEIIAYDDPGYVPLGIEPEMNCLWLSGGPHPKEGWAAKIFSVKVPTCAGAVPPESAGSLKVVRHPLVGIPVEEIPTSGRWMWDYSRNQQFIGLRCGRAWCEVASSGFESATNIVSAADIPGWGDEQLLAIVNDDGVLTLSELIGRISPAEGVGDLQPSDFDGGQEVASVALITAPEASEGDVEAARATYAKKFGFKGEESPIIMKTGGSTGFLLTGDPQAGPGKTDVPGVPWFDVIRSDHKHSGPRTVRWMWDEEDEGVWTSCPQGCCYSRGGFSEDG